MANTLALEQQYGQLVDLMARVSREAVAARAAGDETIAAEKDAEFERIEKEEAALYRSITQMQAAESAERKAASFHLEEIEKSGAKPLHGAAEDEYRGAFRTWFMRGAAAMSPEERSVLEKRGTSNQLAGTTTLGGYTVPTELSRSIIEAMKAYSGIAQACNIMYTAGGNPMTIPTLDDTTTMAVKVAEAATHTIQDLTFGQKTLDAYAYRSALKVSWELMQDSAFNFEGLIRSNLVPRFGRALNNTCTLGDGSGDPNGVVTAASAGKTAASSTAITFAELVDLVHTVDPAYRTSPNCGFMFHDAVLAAIKKLSLGSGDARPLWQPSVREGEPATIEGFRYWINQDMASTIEASAIVALFGDFSYYTIRMVQDLVIRRLDERYADDGLIGYIGFSRWDGELMNTSAVKKYTMSA